MENNYLRWWKNMMKRLSFDGIMKKKERENVERSRRMRDEMMRECNTNTNIRDLNFFSLAKNFKKKKLFNRWSTGAPRSNAAQVIFRKKISFFFRCCSTWERDLSVCKELLASFYDISSLSLLSLFFIFLLIFGSLKMLARCWVWIIIKSNIFEKWNSNVSSLSLSTLRVSRIIWQCEHLVSAQKPHTKARNFVENNWKTGNPSLHPSHFISIKFIALSLDRTIAYIVYTWKIESSQRREQQVMKRSRRWWKRRSKKYWV